jgi:probable phosphoglycerate mutase
MGETNRSTTEIVLVRHGETAWNADYRIQGHLDIPLNAAGMAQAAALGVRFRDDPVDAIYSSDLERAHCTARPIAEQHGQEVRLDAHLRERNLGVLQGLTGDEAKERARSAWAAFTSREPDLKLEGGETLRIFFQRVADFLSSVCERHTGQRVLLVTHGGVLDAAYRLAANMTLSEPRRFPILNASINVLTYQSPTWRVGRWGDVDHLQATSSSGVAAR